MSSRFGITMIAAAVAVAGLLGLATTASAGSQDGARSADSGLRMTCKVSPALVRAGGAIWTIKTRGLSCGKANRTLTSFTRMYRQAGYKRNRLYRVGKFRCRINERLGEGGGVVCRKGSRSAQGLFAIG